MLLCNVSAWAQLPDSVMLDQVTVYGLPEEKYLTGATVYAVDSAFGVQNLSRHLGEMLSFIRPVYFRNYGSGMVSGINLRGTAPHHTVVLWNGLPINSFAHGQSDFSILPGFAFTDVKIHEGGGSARYGSGAFGGTVLLSSSPKGENSLFAVQEAGSFDRFFSALKGNASIGRLAFSTGAYHVQTENNFPIPGRGERQPHAAFYQEGVMQDMRYRWSSSRELSLHYWYHQADREVQPTIAEYNSYDTQLDRNHRLQVGYRHHNQAGLLNMRAGLVDDVIVFNGDESEVRSILTGADHQFTARYGFHVQVGANWNHIVGTTLNYPNGKATENRSDVYASIQKDIGVRLAVALNVKQPFVQGFSSPFLPYLGLEYMLLGSTNQKLLLKGNASKNFRVPTLNDRYWQNLGNAELLPETSYAAEAGLQWKDQTLDVSAILFTQSVDQWIQWVPDTQGAFRPRNLKEVRSRGVEVSLSEKITSGEDFLLTIQVAYQLTESIIMKALEVESFSVGKQLIYTPRHTASSYLVAAWNTWRVTAGAQYAGKRYTEASNQEVFSLNAYALMDVSLSKYFRVNKHRFDLQVTTKNVLNSNYRLYSGRAQPGRSFNVQLVYQLDYGKKKK